MKIIAFDGSPRKRSNSSAMLKAFLDELHGRAEIRYYRTDELDLSVCRGCLMCNALKRCAIRNDQWQCISGEILDADAIVFSTPVYFHHTTSSMKKLIDRFRSFLNVQITEEGIIHKTHQEWSKNFYLFTAHGSSSADDARPLIELFSFMMEVLGPGNELKFLTAVRLALPEQINMDEESLKKAYNKLGLPEELAREDRIRNADYINTAKEFARGL